MDCEKFDLCVMDALYGELDELTLEALKRHVEGCGRCGAAWAGLKATRAGATLPLEEPSDELEARILAAERTVHRHAPWYRKIMRGAAWAGSVAMRPQLAMAALFMFVIGSSLLLLRARPGTMAPPVQVSEQGRPQTESVEEKEGRSEQQGRGAAATAAIGGKGAQAAARDDAEIDNNRPFAPAAAPESVAESGAGKSAASATSSPASPQALALQEGNGCAALETLAKDGGNEEDKKLAENALKDCRKRENSKATPAKLGASATATASPSSSSK